MTNIFSLENGILKLTESFRNLISGINAPKPEPKTTQCPFAARDQNEQQFTLLYRLIQKFYDLIVVEIS